MRQHRRRGFTLVELLVVIGIIALLVSILLPALNSARQQAMTVKCASNLRQIGTAFTLYARDNRGKYPVVKYDKTPPPSYELYRRVDGTFAIIYNRYWVDYLSPYIIKPAAPIESFMNGQKSKEFDVYQQSVLWGCPNWTGSASSAASWNNNGTSVFDNGYAYNIYPTYETNYPVSKTAVVPTKEWAMDSTDAGNPVGSNNVAGKWYPATRWTHPSDRCLVVEANLWLLGFNPTDDPTLAPQSSAILNRNFPTLKGWNNIDRYRHGKYPAQKPGQDGTVYDTTGGKQKFNMLFADGHVSTLQDIKDGYKAIRMKNPGPD